MSERTCSGRAAVLELQSLCAFLFRYDCIAKVREKDILHLDSNEPLASHQSVRNQLVAAINARTLGQTCTQIINALPQDCTEAELTLVKAGQQACIQIASEVDAVSVRLVERLSKADITCEAFGPANSFPQFHHLVMRIAPADLRRALDVVAAEGFAVDEVLKDMIDVIVTCSSSLQLMTWGDFPVRLNLQWRKPKPWFRRLAILSPAPADFAFVHLPSSFSFGYFAVKPLRKLAELLSGQRTADKLGLRAGSFSLGTPSALIAPLLNLVDLGENDVLFDVGCGDGRVLIEAAETFGCKAKGVERNIALVDAARAEARRKGFADRVTIIHGDATKADLEEATIVFLFLPVRLLPAMLKKVKSASRPGTLVVAHEQTPISTGVPPFRREPLIAENAMTVAHVWKC